MPHKIHKIKSDLSGFTSKSKKKNQSDVFVNRDMHEINISKYVNFEPAPDVSSNSKPKEKAEKVMPQIKEVQLLENDESDLSVTVNEEKMVTFDREEHANPMDELKVES